MALHHFTGGFLPNLQLGDVQAIRYGFVAVDLFFVISGFVMAWVYRETFQDGVTAEGWLRFMVARIARIWPMIVLALGLALVLFGSLRWTLPGWPDPTATIPLEGPYSWTGAMQSLFMVSGFFEGVRWNFPQWSISAEMVAYLLAPFVVFAVFRVRLTTLVVLLPVCFLPMGLHVVVSDLLRAGAGQASIFGVVVEGPADGHMSMVAGPVLLARCLPMFLLGAILCRLHLEGRTRLFAHPAVLLGAIATTSVLMQTGQPTLLVIASFVPLVAAIVHSGSSLHRVLNCRPLTWLGDISYAVYLLHIPLRHGMVWLWESLGIDPEAFGVGESWLVFLGLLGLVLMLADLSWRYVEMPARRAIRQAAERQFARRGLVLSAA